MTAVASIFLIGILSCITVATFAWSKRYGNDRIIQLLKHLTKRLTEIVKDKKAEEEKLKLKQQQLQEHQQDIKQIPSSEANGITHPNKEQLPTRMTDCYDEQHSQANSLKDPNTVIDHQIIKKTLDSLSSKMLLRILFRRNLRNIHSVFALVERHRAKKLYKDNHNLTQDVILDINDNSMYCNSSKYDLDLPTHGFYLAQTFILSQFLVAIILSLAGIDSVILIVLVGAITAVISSLFMRVGLRQQTSNATTLESIEQQPQQELTVIIEKFQGEIVKKQGQAQKDLNNSNNNNNPDAEDSHQLSCSYAPQAPNDSNSQNVNDKRLLKDQKIQEAEDVVQKELNANENKNINDNKQLSDEEAAQQKNQSDQSAVIQADEENQMKKKHTTTNNNPTSSLPNISNSTQPSEDEIIADVSLDTFTDQYYSSPQKQTSKSQFLKYPKYQNTIFILSLCLCAIGGYCSFNTSTSDILLIQIWMIASLADILIFRVVASAFYSVKELIQCRRSQNISMEAQNNQASIDINQSVVISTMNAVYLELIALTAINALSKSNENNNQSNNNNPQLQEQNQEDIKDDVVMNGKQQSNRKQQMMVKSPEKKSSKVVSALKIIKESIKKMTISPYRNNNNKHYNSPDRDIQCDEQQQQLQKGKLVLQHQGIQNTENNNNTNNNETTENYYYNTQTIHDYSMNRMDEENNNFSKEHVKDYYRKNQYILQQQQYNQHKQKMQVRHSFSNQETLDIDAEESQQQSKQQVQNGYSHNNNGQSIIDFSKDNTNHNNKTRSYYNRTPMSMNQNAILYDGSAETQFTDSIQLSNINQKHGASLQDQRARKKSSGQIAPLGHASAESSFCNDGNEIAAMSGRVNGSNGQKKNQRNCNTSSSSRRNKGFKVSLEAESKEYNSRNKIVLEGQKQLSDGSEAIIIDDQHTCSDTPSNFTVQPFNHGHQQQNFNESTFNGFSNGIQQPRRAVSAATQQARQLAVINQKNIIDQGYDDDEENVIQNQIYSAQFQRPTTTASNITRNNDSAMQVFANSTNNVVQHQSQSSWQEAAVFSNKLRTHSNNNNNKKKIFENQDNTINKENNQPKQPNTTTVIALQELTNVQSLAVVQQHSHRGNTNRNTSNDYCSSTYSQNQEGHTEKHLMSQQSQQQQELSVFFEKAFEHETCILTEAASPEKGIGQKNQRNYMNNHIDLLAKDNTRQSIQEKNNFINKQGIVRGSQEADSSKKKGKNLGLNLANQENNENNMNIRGNSNSQSSKQTSSSKKKRKNSNHTKNNQNSDLNSKIRDVVDLYGFTLDKKGMNNKRNSGLVEKNESSKSNSPSSRNNQVNGLKGNNKSESNSRKNSNNGLNYENNNRLQVNNKQIMKNDNNNNNVVEILNVSDFVDRTSGRNGEYNTNNSQINQVNNNNRSNILQNYNPIEMKGKGNTAKPPLSSQYSSEGMHSVSQKTAKIIDLADNSEKQMEEFDFDAHFSQLSKFGM